MADNLTAKANTGSGTDVLATDEIGGVHYPRTKISIGADGSATDLSSTNPMPVSDAGGSLTVDGTVAVSGSVTVVDGGGSITVDGTVGISGAVPVTDNGGSLTVDGTITATDGGGSLTVDAPVGTPVFVRLSDGSSAISTLPVSLASVPSHAVTNAGTFVVQADAITPGTGATNLGKAEDAAHASGDVGVMALGVRSDADSALAADGDYHPLAVNEDGRLKVAAMPGSVSATTGTITANGQTVSTDVSKMSNVCLYVTGTFSTINLTFEASIDSGTSWFAVQMVRSNANTVELTTGNLSAAPAYSWKCSVNAYTNFRVRATAYTSGTMNVRILPGAYATEPVVATQSVTVSSGTVTTVTNITNQGHLADNAAFTDGTTRLMMGGFILDETAGTALTENDAAAARVDSKRSQVHVIEDATTRGQRMAVSAAGAAATNLAQVAGNTMLTGAGATGTGSPRVTLASDSPGTTPIVAPRVSVTRPADTTAYAANDAWSSSTSSPANIEFTSMAKSAGKGGVLMTAMVSSSKASSLQFEVQLFDSAPTQVNDNSAFTVSDTDQLKKVGTFQGTLQAAGSSPNSEVTIALNLAYVCAATSLFAMVRVLSAYTPDNAEVLSIRLAAALGD